MNKHIFVFLFIIGAFCLCSCADDFATRINLDGNSSGEDFNSEAALYGTVQDNYGKPVAGVLVSDGIQTTETDAEGNWQLWNTASAVRTCPVEERDSPVLAADFCRRKAIQG